MSNPVIHHALRDIQVTTGATLMTIAGHQVPASFGNDAEAMDAAKSRVALCDRSHWGRIEVSDTDRLRFLHNQSTNDFMSLKPGQGCDTVFVTSTARTLDLVSAYVLDDAVLLLTHPSSCQRLIEWMDRFIFFADKVNLTDRTGAIATMTILGPHSDTVIKKLGADEIIGQPYAHHQVVSIRGLETRIAVGSGLTIPGYTLFTEVDQAAHLWQVLIDEGITPMGELVWDRLRIEQGRPVPEQELTDDYNPLEAGLWNAISFSKGCYIGQETIARLDTYKGVKQQLWGIQLNGPATPGTIVMLGDEKVGKLTSIIDTEMGPFGLAYIRTKAGGAGLTVQVGDYQGTVVDIPFPVRGRKPGFD
jgi:folate-binding protein YgfZ